MNPVLRGLAIYLFLLLVFRIMGKRSLSEATTFDFVLLLIIGEVTQQALTERDYSLTGSFILITSLIGIDLAFSLIKDKSRIFGKITEGVPLIVIDKGKLLKERMHKCRLDEDDILEAARANFGLERIEQIKYAILEKDGTISIVPFEKDR
jgi:uncharacterized membrane protein YcaP (DUF421 family)